ncbi:phosphoserine phosphatase SerB [Agrococcus carbonis]|uniref:phosphoserine phosphatase n=1 Tax=Agrococcus carbonis TaxID=684552 RepID=A0A1H1KVR9_9MICO|nr:phosphoserine phosphatase SerB [Agrococcus carbonis]SDR66130.1 phosphoserine phosphatase [Agrococcus carbonis]
MTRASLLVVTDVDSTLIRDEVIELLARAVGPDAERHVAAVTERAMQGELDFAASLAERLLILEGLPASVVDDARAQVTVTDGVPELIAEVHARGGRIAAVSGGFHEVLDPLAAELGIDHARANRLEVAGGRLTGRSTGPIIDGAAKRDTLESLRANLGVAREAVMAVGDGANDLLMMGAAGVSVAFCAKPAVRERASHVVDVPDFRELLALLPGVPTR